MTNDEYKELIKLYNKCLICKCMDEDNLYKKEVRKIRENNLNQLLKNDNKIDFIDNKNYLNQMIYNSDSYKKYIECKLTKCYKLTELYLDNYIKIYNINYKKENDKYTFEDYVNIKKL